MNLASPRARHALVVLALVMSLGTGCTSSTRDSDDADPTTSGAGANGTEVPALETKIHLGQVTGKLAKPAAKELIGQVALSVDQWIDGAYVAGDYPRTDFAEAFVSFTPGAAAVAKADRNLLTNAPIGATLESVTALKRDVTIDLLAPRGKPGGATARVLVKFETSGAGDAAYVVRGRLSLVPADAGWQIFAYDLTKERLG